MAADRIDLTGLWRFAPDAYDDGQLRGYQAPDHDTALWPEVAVPCSFDDCGLTAYEGGAWFRKTVTVPPGWQGRRIVLRFDGVNYHAKVWINGVAAGGHDYGFLPFELEIGSLLKYGQENVIAVWADNTRKAGEVPGLKRGWRPYGGILRGVSLVAGDHLRIASMRALAEPAGKDGHFTVQVELANGRQTAVDWRLDVEILDATGHVVASMSSKLLVEFAPGAIQHFQAEGRVADAAPWSPDRPALYTARATLATHDADGGGAADQRQVRFGFRKIEIKDGQLLLNGRALFLAGFNRHEDSPRTGMCPDVRTVRDDIVQMKRAGANFVRLCHYPHDEGELDLCDEMGILAMCEIPLYWWAGDADGPENSANTLAAAKRQLADMIGRDWNHPAVIFWSVSNETREDYPDVSAGNAELVRLAKGMDPSRLAVHVSQYWRDFSADDVICLNGYPCWAGSAARHDHDYARTAEYWVDNIRKLRDQYGKPVLVTEFGYPAIKGVCDNSLGEDAQAMVLEAEFAAIDRAGAVGALVWCWADHPWPEEPFIRNLTFSPYGVVTRGRRGGRGLPAIRRAFQQKLGAPFSAPTTTGHRGPAGLPVTMIRLNMDGIPRFALPPGYTFGPMTLDEIGLWTDIWLDADPLSRLDPLTFRRVYGLDLPATAWRVFILRDERGVAVGTTSAWYNRQFKGQDFGQIHWVAIRRAWQNKRLGKGMMTLALTEMAKWHTRAMLDTQSNRLGAIKLYLDFGFAPDLESPGAPDAWREVKQSLTHPLLDGM